MSHFFVFDLLDIQGPAEAASGATSAAIARAAAAAAADSKGTATSERTGTADIVFVGAFVAPRASLFLEAVHFTPTNYLVWCPRI